MGKRTEGNVRDLQNLNFWGWGVRVRRSLSLSLYTHTYICLYICINRKVWNRLYVYPSFLQQHVCIWYNLYCTLHFFPPKLPGCILNVEPIGFSERLDTGWKRKRKMKDDSRQLEPGCCLWDTGLFSNYLLWHIRRDPTQMASTCWWSVYSRNFISTI